MKGINEDGFIIGYLTVFVLDLTWDKTKGNIQDGEIRNIDISSTLVVFRQLSLTMAPPGA